MTIKIKTSVKKDWNSFVNPFEFPLKHNDFRPKNLYVVWTKEAEKIIDKLFREDTQMKLLNSIRIVNI